MDLTEIISEAGVTQREIAAALDVDPSAVSHKLAGRRPWYASEALQLMQLLHDRGVDVELTDIVRSGEAA